jgi:hypothetical protein
MIKKTILLTFIIIGVQVVKAQSNSLPDELWQYAKAARNTIIDNCSGWKDKSTYKVTYYSNDWSINSVTERFKMKIKCSFDGKATGYTYYVIGYLSGDLDGCNVKFMRLEKSMVITSDEVINFGECLE